MPRGEPAIIISHWNSMLENLGASSQAFYAQLEQALAKRQVPDVKISRIYHKEGGAFSAKREYLQVRRREHVFYVCGAPFGNSFFVSWWLGEVVSGFLALLSSIPVLGALVQRFLRPMTYYRIDTALMFQSLTHSAVLEVVDGLMTAKGLRALPDLERKPVLRDFFQR